MFIINLALDSKKNDAQHCTTKIVRSKYNGLCELFSHINSYQTLNK